MTTQDRWVKEMRLAGVTTIDEANALVESKLQPEYNCGFTKKAAGSQIFASEVRRTVDRGLIRI